LRPSWTERASSDWARGSSQQEFDLLLPEVQVIPSTMAPNDAREIFFRADYRTGDPEDLEIRARTSWTGFDADFEPEEYYQPFTLDLDTYDIEGLVTWARGSHYVTGGAGYRRSTIDTSDPEVTDGRHSVNEGWLFAQDEYRATEDLRFTAGLRVDQHSETGTSLSPRAAAVWEFLDDHYFRATYGRGFRNPSLRELWFDMSVSLQGVTGTVLGNDDLDPESLTSYELGYFGAWGRQMDVPPGTMVEIDSEAGSHQFEAGVSVFYNLIDDLIVWDSPRGNPTIVRPENKNDERSYGVEVEGRYLFTDSFSALLNYSYAERENRDSDEEDFVDPLQRVNAGMTYSGYGLSAMLWAHFSDETELDDEEIDSYFLVNGSLSYRFSLALRSDGLVFVRVFNLLDDDHREHPKGDSYGMIFTGGIQFDW
jgi:outer membrane receptor for ferrienterochelin and colicin